jgi:predicted TIM-barrel fold metal-dependent hydrolase
MMRTIIIMLAVCFSSASQPINRQLAAEIAKIKAIDNHAHPVINDGKDQEFDALPVDNLEASSDPVRLRPDSPDTAKAWHALFGQSTPEGMKSAKAAVRSKEGANYPVWVLDRLGIDVMLGNRVGMGGGIMPPRFRWVSYADALMFPLDNSRLAAENTDRKAFFALEDRLLKRYLDECGAARRPATLDEYLAKIVTATLERHKRGGAVAVKFEAAYLRSLDFGKPAKADAERVYSAVADGPPSNADYKRLQDYIFRHIASECGRLGMAVHLHTMAGAGSYFRVAGANPLLLEPLFNDPALRKTNFVMIHGGWPFNAEITALLTKPNAYIDFSGQTLNNQPRTVARSLREWLEFVPEKVMFATDAYPFSPELDWEESGWIAADTARRALAIALSGMMDDGEITYQRAVELARMVLRENARKLYGL